MKKIKHIIYFLRWFMTEDIMEVVFFLGFLTTFVILAILMVEAQSFVSKIGSIFITILLFLLQLVCVYPITKIIKDGYSNFKFERKQILNILSR